MATGFGNFSVTQDTEDSKLFHINFTWRESLNEEYFCIRVFADGEQVNSLYMYVGESAFPIPFYASNLMYGYTYGELRFNVVVAIDPEHLNLYLEQGYDDGLLMDSSLTYLNKLIEDPGYFFRPFVESCIPSKEHCKVVISGADPNYKKGGAYVKCVVCTSIEPNLDILTTIYEDIYPSLDPEVELFIDGLKPNTTYYIKPTFYFKVNGEYVSSGYVDSDGDDAQGYYKFKTENYIVPHWSWETKNQADPVYGGEASSKEVQRAYKAITKVSGYDVNDFSHSVWNDLVEYVRVILEKTKDTWSTYENETGKTYLDRENTLMSNGEYTLTAEKFNALRFNIGSRESTGITDRKKGDIVYGNYFTTLTECINRWISNKL